MIDGYTKIVYNFVKNGGQLTEKDVRLSRLSNLIYRHAHFQDLILRKFGMRQKVEVSLSLQEEVLLHPTLKT
jgi:hypothetical protein